MFHWPVAFAVTAARWRLLPSTSSANLRARRHDRSLPALVLLAFLVVLLGNGHRLRDGTRLACWCSLWWLRSLHRHSQLPAGSIVSPLLLPGGCHSTFLPVQPCVVTLPTQTGPVPVLVLRHCGNVVGNQLVAERTLHSVLTTFVPLSFALGSLLRRAWSFGATARGVWAPCRAPASLAEPRLLTSTSAFFTPAWWLWWLRRRVCRSSCRLCSCLWSELLGRL